MKNSTRIKTILFFSAFSFLFFAGWSQECSVEKQSLKGEYTGDCKKGKAHGKGKAVGADTYEGEFKSGQPDGQGTYTWNSGNTFKGKYVKGFRDGKGTMTFKKAGGQDSIVEGFWKKDVYIGKYEKPWIVHSKTGSIRDVRVEFSPDPIRRIKVIITNTSGGVPTTSGASMPRYTVDNVHVLKGSYERITHLESHLKSTETSLIDTHFPLHVKLSMAREELEIEFLEAGSYIVTISINQ